MVIYYVLLYVTAFGRKDYYTFWIMGEPDYPFPSLIQHIVEKDRGNQTLWLIWGGALCLSKWAIVIGIIEARDPGRGMVAASHCRWHANQVLPSGRGTLNGETD